MSKDNLRQVLISVFVGACVAFLTTLFHGLELLITNYATETFAGITASAVYVAKSYHA